MRRKVIGIIFLFVLIAPAFAAPATKDDIKQLIHYMDKRFEAVDRRFEDMQKHMDKRFDMMMWFIGTLTVLGTGVVSYMISRINRQDSRIDGVEIRTQHVDLSALLRDLRQADPAIKKGLKEILK